MAKLVRCTVGRILDVAIDLRVSSPTFGKWFSVELTCGKQDSPLCTCGICARVRDAVGSLRSSVQANGFLQSRQPKVALPGTILKSGFSGRYSNPILSSKDQRQPSLC